MSHYAPYPAYKESGVEWLGRVPEGWSVKRLKRNLKLLTEKADRKLRPVGLENIESWTGRFIETESDFEGDGTEFEQFDILFGKLRPYLAKVYLATSPGEAVGDFFVLRPNPSMHGAFVTFQLLSREFINLVDGSTYGAKMPRVSWDFFGEVTLPTPPLAEQRSITTHLDRETVRLDGLVAKKTRFIELLREKRQALITHAVTKGLDPTAKMKDSNVEWLGQVPEHWAVRPIKHLAKFFSGGTPSKDTREFWDGTVPWASAKDLKRDRLHDTEDHITEVALRAGEARLVPVDSVLVVVRGMILARIFPVVEVGVPMAINQDLKALVARPELHPKFLALLLRGLADESLRRLEEAGHGTKALRMEAWTSMEVTVPPFAEQQNIVSSIDRQTTSLDTLIEKTERSIALIKERRAALITAAVTGQIDLRAAA